MRTRLTEKQRRQVCVEYAEGLPLEEIADRYKISRYYPIKLARKAGIPPREFGPNPKRQSRRDWQQKNAVKRTSHKKVEYALIRRTIERKPCERCGARAHAYHDNYLQPLDVRWLCSKHGPAPNRKRPAPADAEAGQV